MGMCSSFPEILHAQLQRKEKNMTKEEKKKVQTSQAKLSREEKW